jgi:hypothetical protein
MMLAHPGFFITQTIQMLDQFHVALNAQRGIFIDRMKWREKDSVPEFHGNALPRYVLGELCHG